MVKQMFITHDKPISFIMISETTGIPTSYLTSFAERLLLNHDTLDFTLPSGSKAYSELSHLIVDIEEFIDKI